MASLTPESIHKIVKVLESDGEVFEKWIELCDNLDIPDSQSGQWRREFRAGLLNPYSLFKNIITFWHSQKGIKVTVSTLSQIFRKLQMNLGAESLEKLDLANPAKPTSSTLSRWPIFFNVTKVNRNYVGRTQELSKLEQIYESQSHNIVIISGLGGIGKSELTRQFAHNLFKKEKINCTWFNGETPQNLQISINELAEMLKVPILDPSNNQREINEIMMNVLELGYQNEAKSWLIILDNVQSKNSELTSLLDFLFEIPNILVILTTRNIEIADEEMKLISLEKWINEDAVEFLKKTLTFEKDDEVKFIPKLCKKLENHALAMNQAVAYIIERRRNSTKGLTYGISDYLSEFKFTAEKLLGFSLSQRAHKNIKPVLYTWDMTIENLKTNYRELGKFACHLLNDIAYLDPAGIPTLILEKTNKFKGQLVDKAVELLKRFSLIKCEDYIVYVHRLVQEITRIKLKSAEEESAILVLLLVKMENKHSPNVQEVTHLQCVWKFASQIDRLVRTSGSASCTVSNGLYINGFYSEMLKFCEKYLPRLTEVLSENHLSTVGLKGWLAKALELEGNYDKSVKIYKEVWQKYKDLGKMEFAHKLSNNLAEVLLKLDKSEEAKSLYNSALEATTSSLGNSHKDTMTMKGNFALLFQISGEFIDDEALKILKDVLEWQERELGPFHHDTLLTKHNIGATLVLQHKFVEAKTLLEDVIECRKKLSQEDHPLTLQSMHFLAGALWPLGDRKKSMEMLDEVLGRQKQILGIDHQDTKRTQHALDHFFKIYLASLSGSSLTIESRKRSYTEEVSQQPLNKERRYDDLDEAS